MELRQLQYFAVLAEELHFGRAAERLHIVQPAVTQQIQRLERSLGVDLFDRSRRQIQLTPAGERLVPEVRRVLEAVARAVAVARQEPLETLLQLGTTQGLGPRLDAVLAEFVSARPGTGVELHGDPVEQRLQAVRTGRLHATFVRGMPVLEGVDVIRLWQDPMVVVLAEKHPLAELPEISLAQLAEVPLRLVARERNPPFHDLVMSACRAAGFEPIRGPEFTTLQNTLAEIAVGPPAWTVMAGSLTADRSGIERVVHRPVSDPVLVETSLVVAAPAGELTQALVEACLKVAAPAPVA